MITAWADGRQVIDVEGMFVNSTRTLHLGGQSTAYCDTGSTEITQKLSRALVRQGLLVLANTREKKRHSRTIQRYGRMFCSPRPPVVLEQSRNSGT